VAAASSENEIGVPVAAEGLVHDLMALPSSVQAIVQKCW